MTPQMRERLMRLSPEVRSRLLAIFGRHTLRSDRATPRQVMMEVLMDAQAMVAGLAMAHPEQVAAAARRLAGHRLPRGGLLPYLPPEKVTDAHIASLVGFNDIVEGNALRTAEAAERGDLGAATEHFGAMMKGCVACHEVFRGVPGRSPYLR